MAPDLTPSRWSSVRGLAKRSGSKDADRVPSADPRLAPVAGIANVVTQVIDCQVRSRHS